jgi:hypothetical protein
MASLPPYRITYELVGIVELLTDSLLNKIILNTFSCFDDLELRKIGEYEKM